MPITGYAIDLDWVIPSGFDIDHHDIYEDTRPILAIPSGDPDLVTGTADAASVSITEKLKKIHYVKVVGVDTGDNRKLLDNVSVLLSARKKTLK